MPSRILHRIEIPGMSRDHSSFLVRQFVHYGCHSDSSWFRSSPVCEGNRFVTQRERQMLLVEIEPSWRNGLGGCSGDGRIEMLRIAVPCVAESPH